MLFENDMAAFVSMIQYAVLATTSDWDYLYMQSAEQCSVAPQKWPYLLEISAVLRSFGVVHLQSINPRYTDGMDKSHAEIEFSIFRLRSSIFIGQIFVGKNMAAARSGPPSQSYVVVQSTR